MNLKTLAMATGYSISTVSRVVLGRGEVSDATREKVKTAIEKFGYPTAPRPGGRGRPRKRDRRPALAVVCGQHAEVRKNPFFAPILSGLLNACAELGCESVAFDWPKEQLEVPQGLYDTDGVLFVNYASEHVRIAAERRPTITVDTYYPGSGADGVVPDYRHGTFEAVKHLLSKGHRRISVISGQRGDGEDYYSQLHDGARRALANANVEPWEDFLAGMATNSQEGYAIAERLLARPERQRPTAIIGNDHASLGVLRAAHDARVKVPDDLAVMGVDDIELGQFVTPRLSTVRVDKEMLARAAVERMLWRLARPAQPSCRLMLDCPLVLRDSA
ncbi:MAG: LacI family DNA-binding transcriptional regulator [Planctomycetes bacterium]|nr:LacI family DNA-binding transcriptional regulator [Planctomycetota bacterium]